MGNWRPALGILIFFVVAGVIVMIAMNLGEAAQKIVQYTASDDVAKMVFSAGNSSKIYIYDNGSLVRNESVLQQYGITYTKYTAGKSEWFSLPLVNLRAFSNVRYLILLLAFFLLVFVIATAWGR